MKVRALLLVLVGFACGWSVSILIYRRMPQQQSEAPETVQVLVAAEDLPLGLTLLSPGSLFKYVTYIKGHEPDGSVQDLDELEDRLLLNPLGKDQPVKRWDVSSRSVPIDPGRTFLACISPREGIGAFIIPGTRVNLYHTFQEDGKWDHKLLTENVPLLGEFRRQLTTVGLPEQYGILVAATPDQAFQISQAKTNGTVSAVFRSGRQQD